MLPPCTHSKTALRRLKKKENVDAANNAGKNKNSVVDEAADGALSSKNKDSKEHRKHHKDKKQSPADKFSSQSNIYEKEWQPLAEQLFTCRHAPAVCNPDILKRLHYALLAAAKMHSDIWYIGGWWLSMLGFVVLVAGIAISWLVDGDNAMGKRGTGKGPGVGGAAAGGKGAAAGQADYQPVSTALSDDEESDSDGGIDIESPTKDRDGGAVSRNHVFLPQSGAARYAAKFALFWNRRIARKDGATASTTAGVADRRSKKSKKTNKTYTSSGTSSANGSSEHFSENEMTFLPSPTAKSGGVNARFIADSDSEDDDDDDTSPSKLKRSPYHIEINNLGPEATSLSAIVKRIPSNLMEYWTNTTLYFVQPLLSFKIFLAFLLFVELNEIMAPEQSMLATPEVVKLIRTYPKKHEYVNPYVQWIMPGMVSEDEDGGASVEGWVKTLEFVRFVLICSWFGFILCPKKYNKLVGGGCYAVGAVLYGKQLA